MAIVVADPQPRRWPDALGVDTSGKIGADKDDVLNVLPSVFRAWSESNFRLKCFRKPYPCGAGFASTAKCDKCERGCTYAVRAYMEPGGTVEFRGNGNPHQGGSAVARAFVRAGEPVSEPMSKDLRDAYDNSLGHGTGLRRRKPKDVHGEVGEALAYGPGAAVANMKKRKVAKERGATKLIDAADLDSFCNERAVDLEALGGELPQRTSRLSVFKVETAPSLFCMVFACCQFIVRLAELARADPEAAADGFVAMSDFTFKIVWHGYALGCLGVVLFRRDPRGRWRRVFWPVMLVMSPTENHSHYE